MKKNFKMICWFLLLFMTMQIILPSDIYAFALDENSAKGNTMELGLTMDEDFDSNGIIDILDLAMVSSKYNAVKGDSHYDLRYDLNKDNIIDIYDLVKVSNKIGSEPMLLAGDYEETSSLLKFSGQWNSNSNSLHSGGIMKYSITSGSYVEFKFYGTGFEWYGQFGVSGGKAKVYIDGSEVTTHNCNFYATHYNKLAYYNNNLPLGEHTVRIEVLGQGVSGKEISIDRIVINNNDVSNNYYKVYQGGNYIGQYSTKEAAIREGGLYANSYVVDSKGNEVWSNTYRVYQRYYDGSNCNVIARFTDKDSAIANGKKWKHGYVIDPNGVEIWNNGYPAKINKTAQEVWGPSNSHSNGTSISGGTDITVLNREGNYYQIEYGSLKRVYVLISDVSMSSKFIPPIAQYGSNTLYANTDQSVYGGPSTSDYSIVDTIGKAQQVNVLKTEDSFSYVEYETSTGIRRGYVLSKNLVSTRPTVLGMVNVSGILNVRKGPGTGYEIIGTLPDGVIVEIIDSSNPDWHKITFNDGFGYVHKDYISFSSPYKSIDYYVDMQVERPLNLTDLGGTWRDATRDEIKYYMDPVNFVNNDGKYMFMKLTYNSQIPSSVVEEVVSGRGILSGKGAAFIEGAKKYNINPIYLACHARLETGNGTSTLSKGILVNTVDGKPVTPRVVYNMYGIGAVDSDPVKLGAERAYKEGWFTPELAISEGAKWVGSNYINNSSFYQDTLYKMRWNLTPSGVSWHQYATDIGWAYKQAKMMAPYLNKCGNINLDFEIPLFSQVYSLSDNNKSYFESQFIEPDWDNLESPQQEWEDKLKEKVDKPEENQDEILEDSTEDKEHLNQESNDGIFKDEEDINSNEDTSLETEESHKSIETSNIIEENFENPEKVQDNSIK